MTVTPSRKNVLAIVLAGGEGKRLMPLTADRAKPAVPFGGIYRLIDFALSNVVNSGYLKVVVLTQYKSHSLDRHITTTWRMSTLLGNYVTPVPAQQRVGKRWYLGSADAIFQSLNLLTDERPDIVVVVGADHVYRMDFCADGRPARRVGRGLHGGGDPAADRARRPVRRHRRRPEVARPDPGVPGEAEGPGRAARTRRDEVLASMGNYVFDADALDDAVTRDAELERSKHDMGGDIVPWFVDRSESAVYDYKDNEVPGSNERDRGYWRDVGTMRSYYAAHMDLVAPLPVFNLYNTKWPIYTSYGPQPPAKLVEGHAGEPLTTFNSILSPGVVVTGGTVNTSVLSPACRVDDGRRGVRLGAALRRDASGPVPSYATRSSTRTSWSRPGAEIGVDAGGRPGARLRGRGRTDRARQGPGGARKP